MSSVFPESEFKAFGRAASAFFPDLLSDEALSDPLKKRQQFDRSYQAVRYRYRLSYDSCAEFKELLSNPSESWKAGWGDEELNYKLERCIYLFFMSSLSVFESLVFCLYFFGHAINPREFPHVNSPRKICLTVTSKAFLAAFPQAEISQYLSEMPQKPEYVEIETHRNILAHRLSGRRSVKLIGIIHPDGTDTSTIEETWDIPCSAQNREFNDGFLHQYLDEVTNLLRTLISSAAAFADLPPQTTSA